jgi:Tfp pilus assembly protein PilN
VGWVVGGVWIAAVVLAIVVLGFCAYEITWKTQRVQRDLGRLTGLNEELTALQREVQVVQRRIADAAAESTG